ncbi:hypothetical protein L5515_008796 [Caenorhabditis briggsae]|uniref:Transthyretin-like family protein n=1 Tax=Caenorhabditis briggsae TaxID=6238 RepID=A0AAE9JN51_CAEBR|nr:hypothetical protein L3Y34_008959 [Caenorhabditis briggsae]UMM36793.1 hypothetical protein L5515_008796 [Caenorhabditis briggsae]
MILILLFLFFAPASTLYQSYGVHGQFSCGESPAKGITVKLYDLDRYSHENDLLDEGVTNGFGNITLSGGTAELTRIEPMLEVIHDCNDGGKVGNRKSKFLLPQVYITYGTKALKTYDIGNVNLETIFLSEDRDYSDETVQKSSENPQEI